MAEPAALVREVNVPAAPATAFDVFCARIGDWWPLGAFAVFGDGSVTLDGGGVGARIVETAADGRTSVWGTVTEWDAPDAVAFTWNPGSAAERASRVRVTFTGSADGRTRVQLSHSGWEVYADPAASRETYGSGWPSVLGAYAARIEAATV